MATPKLQADSINIQIPRPLFEQMREIGGVFNEFLGVAEEQIKADEAVANADVKAQEMIQKIGPGMVPPDALAGLENEMPGAIPGF